MQLLSNIFTPFLCRKVAGAIRVAAGRKSVAPNLAESLKSRNHSLDHMFYAKSLMLEEKKKKKADDESDDESYEEESLEDGNCQYVEKIGVSLGGCGHIWSNYVTLCLYICRKYRHL